MKKNFLTTTIIITMIFCLFSTACVSKTDVKYIDKYYNKFCNSTSVSLDMLLDAGDLGAYYVTRKIENNKTYQSAFGGEEPFFTEEIDGYIYTYKKQSSSWVRDNGVAKDSEVTGADEILKLFNGENYDYNKVKECFVLKDVVTVNFNGLKLSNSNMQFEGDVCTIKSVATMEGITCSLTIMFYDLNNTTVNLPSIS